MLQRIQEYTVDHIGVPTDEEIEQAIRAKMYMPDTVQIHILLILQGFGQTSNLQ